MSVHVCGLVSASFSLGRIHFTPLLAGSGSLAAHEPSNGKQMGPDGDHMGLGVEVHSCLTEPPASRPPPITPSRWEPELTVQQMSAACVEPAGGRQPLP